jgi:hypothetical protein
MPMLIPQLPRLTESGGRLTPTPQVSVVSAPVGSTDDGNGRDGTPGVDEITALGMGAPGAVAPALAVGAPGVVLLPGWFDVAVVGWLTLGVEPGAGVVVAGRQVAAGSGP